jgi:hypothetical protein
VGAIVLFFILRPKHWHLTLFTVWKNGLILFIYSRTNTSIQASTTQLRPTIRLHLRSLIPTGMSTGLLHLRISWKITLSVSIGSTCVTLTWLSIWRLIIRWFNPNRWNIWIQLIVCPYVSTYFSDSFSCKHLTHLVDDHVFLVEVDTGDGLTSSVISFVLIGSD